MTELTSHKATAGSIPETAAGGILHVDLDGLASNWRTLRDKAGGAETAAVVYIRNDLLPLFNTIRYGETVGR